MKVRSVNCLLQYIKLTLTALAPQLFRDLVVRSFCVSRFTVNKKALVPVRSLLCLHSLLGEEHEALTGPPSPARRAGARKQPWLHLKPSVCRHV